MRDEIFVKVNVKLSGESEIRAPSILKSGRWMCAASWD
jgi:hypothetical protein